ncbi:hypothetical protein IAT40_002832 [Kwoniella sp. CBS 6097]
MNAPFQPSQSSSRHGLTSVQTHDTNVVTSSGPPQTSDANDQTFPQPHENWDVPLPPQTYVNSSVFDPSSHGNPHGNMNSSAWSTNPFIAGTSITNGTNGTAYSYEVSQAGVPQGPAHMRPPPSAAPRTHDSHGGARYGFGPVYGNHSTQEGSGSAQTYRPSNGVHTDGPSQPAEGLFRRDPRTSRADLSGTNAAPGDYTGVSDSDPTGTGHLTPLSPSGGEMHQHDFDSYIARMKFGPGGGPNESSAPTQTAEVNLRIIKPSAAQTVHGDGNFSDVGSTEGDSPPGTVYHRFSEGAEGIAQKGGNDPGAADGASLADSHAYQRSVAPSQHVARVLPATPGPDTHGMDFKTLDQGHAVAREVQPPPPGSLTLDNDSTPNMNREHTEKLSTYTADGVHMTTSLKSNMTSQAQGISVRQLQAKLCESERTTQAALDERDLAWRQKNESQLGQLDMMERYRDSQSEVDSLTRRLEAVSERLADTSARLELAGVQAQGQSEYIAKLENALHRKILSETRDMVDEVAELGDARSGGYSRSRSTRSKRPSASRTLKNHPGPHSTLNSGTGDQVIHRWNEGDDSDPDEDRDHDKDEQNTMSAASRRPFI